MAEPIGTREYAERHGYASPQYVANLCAGGRIAGAVQDEATGRWKIPPDAPRTTPSEAQRAEWREQWTRQNRAEKQRRRRARKREQGVGV